MPVAIQTTVAEPFVADDILSLVAPDASEVEAADGSVPLVAVSFADSDYQRIPVEHEKLHESIVPVVTWTEGGPLIAWGTAFAITQGGLFLTARHVVDEFLDEYVAAIDNGSQPCAGGG